MRYNMVSILILMFFVCFQLHSIHAQPAQQLLVQKQQRQLSDVAAANER